MISVKHRFEHLSLLLRSFSNLSLLLEKRLMSLPWTRKTCSICSPLGCKENGPIQTNLDSRRECMSPKTKTLKHLVDFIYGCIWS